jgi:hypothetical protein
MGKLSMTSPLVPLASNELFERPGIVPHNACHFCYMERESAATTETHQLNYQKPRGAPWRQASRSVCCF